MRRNLLWSFCLASLVLSEVRCVTPLPPGAAPRANRRVFPLPRATVLSATSVWVVQDFSGEMGNDELPGTVRSPIFNVGPSWRGQATGELLLCVNGGKVSAPTAARPADVLLTFVMTDVAGGTDVYLDIDARQGARQNCYATPALVDSLFANIARQSQRSPARRPEGAL
jgi:hypothetical protein